MQGFKRLTKEVQARRERKGTLRHESANFSLISEDIGNFRLLMNMRRPSRKRPSMAVIRTLDQVFAEEGDTVTGAFPRTAPSGSPTLAYSHSSSHSA